MTATNSANQNLIDQTLRHHIAGTERINLTTENKSTDSEVTDHPVMQTAIAQFQNKIVAMQPHITEGEDQ